MGDLDFLVEVGVEAVKITASVAAVDLGTILFLFFLNFLGVFTTDTTLAMPPKCPGEIGLLAADDCFGDPGRDLVDLFLTLDEVGEDGLDVDLVDFDGPAKISLVTAFKTMLAVDKDLALANAFDEDFLLDSLPSLSLLAVVGLPIKLDLEKPGLDVARFTALGL